MRDVSREVDAIWRIEGARIVATLAKATGDVSLAEDLAQEALADALDQWPGSGVPQSPGAWLTTVARRKAIDWWRRERARDERYQRIAGGLVTSGELVWDPIPDDVLRLVFVSCHPVLSPDARVALTLRVVGGLSSEEIARMHLVPTSTIQQRVVRAKKTLAAAGVPFEIPDAAELAGRLSGVLSVIYLMFTEGYAATSGERWFRKELAEEALRLGRIVSTLLPRQPEVHGLVALMEFQSSRFAARVGRDGNPVLLEDQDRTLWDRGQIERGRSILRRADAIGKGRGPYALQAAIAERHAVAVSIDQTDWKQIVLLYDALGRLAPTPVVELNRAVAVSMAYGPEHALPLVDRLAEEGALRGSHLLPSVRGELLLRLDRVSEAEAELEAAAALARNERQRYVLREKLDGIRRSED